MYGFQHNDVDPHNRIPIRSLKVLLRSNLPALQPKIQRRIEEEFSEQLEKAPCEDGTVTFDLSFKLSRVNL